VAEDWLMPMNNCQPYPYRRLRVISERDRVNLGIPERSVRGHLVFSYRVFVDKRCLERYQRRHHG
jgi:hypothetical protein